ncbi:MAG TPA: tetratricopeptide repeat protein [Candidatus Acidoferrales bacterium]|nr:tetratricopeptide repeat protein [Candidatus Acidoferrales bacterium]
MINENLKEQARELFHQAYERQRQGELEDAITLYQKSIALFPTAEAHTFLGWTYSFQGRYDDAIEECQRAIAVDPDFGNPYNDIGAYLIEEGHVEEAIPWLEKATHAPRYESRCFPYFNLGRVHEARRHYAKALDCYKHALGEQPAYPAARCALRRLQAMMN